MCHVVGKSRCRGPNNRFLGVKLFLVYVRLEARGGKCGGAGSWRLWLEFVVGLWLCNGTSGISC